MQHSSRFASTFAPYTPPPDDPAAAAPPPHPPAFPRIKQTWFPPPPSPPLPPSSSSYQSGAVPSFGNAAGGGGAAAAEEGAAAAQLWETRLGWRVDACAAAAYLGGPFTALLFLILETANDFVRFHAYQSALLTTPLLVLRALASFVFPSWLQTLLTLALLAAQAGMAIRAFRDASRDLARYELPYIGEVADRWVGEE